MPVRKGSAVWKGKLKKGSGTVRLGSGAFEGPVSYASRFENGEGTNPEELIGAAHAACFSMALAHILGENGYDPKKIETTADVTIEMTAGSFKITSVKLDTRVRVADIGRDDFRKYVEEAKETCPVSEALGGVKITVKLALEN
jgi:osmotically inducible protein OsmC